MVDCPEHEKLKAVSNKSQACGEFMEWLGEKGLFICEADRHDLWQPARVTREKLLAEFFDIDLQRLENEKRQILDEQRELTRQQEESKHRRKLRLAEIVAELKAGGMRCNCDLDNWEPEQNTGHSWVCRIHKEAMRRISQ